MSLLGASFFVEHPDARLLVARLTDLIGQQPQAVTLVGASGIRPGWVDWQGGMEDVWPRVLKVAADRGRLRSLVQQAALLVPEEPLFARLLDEDTRPTALAINRPNAWQTPRLWTTFAMIDRAPLRMQLERMQNVDGQRALLVVGERQTGKSHARRFLSYLSEIRILPRVVIIDNSLRAGTPITVQELAQKVAWAVAGVDAPKFDLVAQPESIASRFHDWLSGVIAEIDEPVWLVFDQFTPDKTSAPAMQLIADLATNAADYRLGPMRVVVCGYSGAAIPYPGAATDSVTHPSSDEVRLFFKRMSELLTGVASEDEAIEVMFEAFVAQGGLVEDRPIAELGPSALAFATKIFEPVPI